MKDSSGASVMDPKTQVTSVHGYSVLDLALPPLEANFALPLVHETAGENDRAMLDIAVAAEINLVGDASARRGRGCARSRQLAQHDHGRGGGDHRPEPRRADALACTRALIDLFAHSGLLDARDESFDSQLDQGRRDRPARCSWPRRRGGRPAARGDAQGGARSRRPNPLFLNFLEALGRASLAGRDPGGDLDHDRVGSADAQAHLPPHRRDAAVVSAPVWRDDRRLHSGRAPSARQPVRHPARGALRPLDDG